MSVSEPITAIRRDAGDPKRIRILEGAFKVFLAYGFTRTTMDDIAKAAELSRPALYVVFRNKSDIYKAIARCVMAQCEERASLALEADGPLLARLDRLVEHALFDMMREIEESPHGLELIDMKNSLAGDVIEEWRGKIDGALARAIEEETGRTGVDLASRGFSAQSLAQTFFDALEGMKPRLSDPNHHLEAAKKAARMLVAAIRP